MNNKQNNQHNQIENYRKSMFFLNIFNVLCTLPSEEILHKVVSHIPNKELCKYSNNHPLMVEWVNMRTELQLLSIGLLSRLENNINEPIKTCLDIGEINQHKYNILIQEIDFWESIFHLVEEGWQYLESDLKEVLDNNSCLNQYDYFIQMLKGFYDDKYYQCFLGFKKTIREIENSSKQMRNFCWLSPSENDWLNRTKWKNTGKTIDDITKRRPGSVWMIFLFNVLNKYSKQNKQILNQLKIFVNLFGKISDYHAKETTKERGKNPPRQYVSIKWKEGMCYLGTTGGWKRCRIRFCLN